MYSLFHGELVSSAEPTDQTLRNYFPDYNYLGTIIEVGGYDPIVLSNSYHFEQNGWDAYCIEANGKNFEKFANRKNALNYACADFNQDGVEFDLVTSGGWTAGFSSLKLDENLADKFGRHNIKNIEKIKVNVRKLDTLLEAEMNGIKKIDILTIDVEGSEMQVLKGFDLKRWMPTIVFIENHFFNDGECEIHKYLIENGYTVDRRVEYNFFYKKA